MKRFIRFRWAGAACAGLLAFIAVPKSQAQSFTSITPGGTVTPLQVTTTTDPELIGATVVATTGTQTYTTIIGSTDIGGSVNETVYKQTNGVLDFVLQFNNSNTTAQDVLHATMANFTVPGVTTAVAYENITGLEPFGGPGNVAPTSVTDSAGTLNFLTSVASGQTSDALIIQTNATTFTTGVLSLQNEATFSLLAFAPLQLSTVPETGSLLCGLAVAAFAGFRLFRRKGGNGEMSGLAA